MIRREPSMPLPVFSLQEMQVLTTSVEYYLRKHTGGPDTLHHKAYKKLAEHLRHIQLRYGYEWPESGDEAMLVVPEPVWVGK